MADPLNGKYGDVLRPFVAMMEAELHANSGKGDRPGWLSMTRQTALLEIYYHVAKLQKAAKNDDGALIREHAADVANMAMMLLDVCVGIQDTATPPQAKPAGPAQDVRVPLTEAQMWDIAIASDAADDISLEKFESIIRAVESAHGITQPDGGKGAV